MAKVRVLWQELKMKSPGDLQEPPLTKVSAASVLGLDTRLVQVELGRKGCDVSAIGADDGLPWLHVSHTDDKGRQWTTETAFPKMKGYYIWSAMVTADNVKVAFAEELR